MLGWIKYVVTGAVLLVATGCGDENQTKPIGSDSMAQTGEGERTIRGSGKPRPVSGVPGADASDDGLQVRKPGFGRDVFPAEEDEEDVPTGLLITTCDSEPIEIAVPLNAGEHKFCDSIVATAYRADDNGSYQVPADFVWAMEEPEIADLEWSAKPQGAVRRLDAKYDVFHVPGQDVEPTTELLVCATARSGGPDFYPLCRSLPVKAVANLEGAWCFSGATFDAECTDVTILQDGRYLFVDGVENANGSIRTRSVEFSRPGRIYSGYADANDYLYGVVRDGDTDELLGTWTAWRLPLF